MSKSEFWFRFVEVLIVAVAGVVVSAAGVYVGFKQEQIATKQLEVSEKQLDVSERELAFVDVQTKLAHRPYAPDFRFKAFDDKPVGGRIVVTDKSERARTIDGEAKLYVEFGTDREEPRRILIDGFFIRFTHDQKMPVNRSHSTTTRAQA